MSFARALMIARERQDDEAALGDLARSALDESAEEDALPLVRKGAEQRRSAGLWQWTGLLERSLDQHGRALMSFEQAAALDPTDGSIAHGRAQVALEAGVPAEHLFEAALRVAHGNAEVLRGFFAALFASGQADRAEVLLDSVLEGSPFWIDGHVQLAQMRAMMGKRVQATASLDRALARHPAAEQLWAALFDLLLRAEEFSALDEAVARARKHLHGEQMLLRYEAIAAGEAKDSERADRLFALIGADSRQSIEVWRLRHLLRTERVKDACMVIDAALGTEIARHVWPYASLAWRLAGDPRWEWLEGDLDRMVSVIDLTSKLPDMHALQRTLRKLHLARGEFLDQSVRGGSQTDGPLFCRIDPEIQSLRSAIVTAVEQYVGNLPVADGEHPLLGPRRDRAVRFAGSWSVLLRGAGFHTSHVHPEGWISSALYIHLPQQGPDDPPTAGWLTLGEPQAQLGLDLEPFREIEPKRGHLVLFPSYMWHGTRPFAQGERLTVAFDVRRPI